MPRLDYEKILQENLSEGAFAIITKNEKEFADWIERVKYQAKRCDELFRELKHYKDLEEQGLLLKLPCKVGDILYKIYKKPTKCSVHGQYRDDYSCCGCEEEECDSFYEWSIYEYKATIKDIACLADEIGKTVFLTKTKAEEELKKMESEG